MSAPLWPQLLYVELHPDAVDKTLVPAGASFVALPTEMDTAELAGLTWQQRAYLRAALTYALARLDEAEKADLGDRVSP